MVCIYISTSLPLCAWSYIGLRRVIPLVLKSNTIPHFSADVVEVTICRLCNDIAEDAIYSKCHHIFDRECIKQYCEAAVLTAWSATYHF